MKLKYFDPRLAAGIVLATLSLCQPVHAADKVVVIPLYSSDPDLLPQNISYGVTIHRVTGTYGPPPPTTVTSAGQIWMDRNLGASRVAISSDDAAAYGDLYQWGRPEDGHERRISPTDTNLSDNDAPGHGSFIIADNDDGDWRSPPNNDLWQGAGGKNNPCPSGFRLPTETELETERLSWGTNDTAGAFDSPLKLTAAGYRYRNTGTINYTADDGYYWSSTASPGFSRLLTFYSDNITFTATTHGVRRANGASVRCIKD